MHLPSIGAVLIVSAGLLAQSPPPCPADRPVDEIIAAIKDSQAKHKHRNKNPLPQSICILGWCRGLGSTSPPASTEHKPDTDTARQPTGDYSSSKAAVDPCSEAMENALEAAHNVEVGDYYVEKGSYQAALSRYRDAAEQKVGDAAIHVRLGRVYEKFNDRLQAIKEYEIAEKLAAPEQWTQEARAAMARLQQQPN